MSDLISRQAAITIPILPKWNRKYLTTNLDDAYELGWDDCQKCIEAIPSAEPQWIPVSERLPEEKRAVLVYEKKYRNMYTAYYDPTLEWVTFSPYSNKCIGEYWDIVAWMPLPPEPWKGADDE